MSFRNASASPLTQVQNSTIPISTFAPHTLLSANMHSCKTSFLETAMHVSRQGTKRSQMEDARSASEIQCPASRVKLCLRSRYCK